jgi:hypothetical protein
MKPFLAIFLVVFSTLQAIAQSPIEVLKCSAPPVLDGRLDDQIWSQVARYDDFISYTPEFGKPAEFRTVTMMTYDESSFYVAFDCFDPDPSKLKATITARDQIKTEDWVCINLDPFFDQQSLVTLYVNPLGIQEDGRSAAHKEDTGADYVFYSKGSINDHGYQVEIQVPFKSLRYQRGDEVIMGFILERRIQRLSQQSCWPALQAEKGMNFLTQTLPFSFKGIRHYTLVELLPAFTYSRQRSQIDGNLALTDNRPSVSFTGKLGITSQLTLDLAVNPDFSQVESDAGQIEENQRYALYYPEKRPFFQEGKENFNIAGISEYGFLQQGFHTRQIADPLIGIKLSGKITSKDRLALLYAMDGQLLQKNDNEIPPVQFLIGRYHHTIKDDNYVGGFITDKEMPDGEFNRVAGLDGRIRFSPSTTMEINLLGSQTRHEGDVNPVNDWLGTMLLSKSTDRLNASVELQHIGDQFITESGFLRRSGIDKLGLNFSYAFYPKKGFFSKVGPDFFGLVHHDIPSGLFEQDFGFGIMVAGPRSTSFHSYINPCNEVYNGVKLPTSCFLVMGQTQIFKSLRFQTEYRLGLLTRYVEHPYTGYGNVGTFSFNYQPVQKFQSDLILTYSDFYNRTEGDLEFRYLILRSRNTYQINPKLFLRAIVEYNSFEKTISTDFLVSFTYIPGTVVYLGYGSLYDRMEWNGHMYQPGSDLMEMKRGLFFKASYLWRN